MTEDYKNNTIEESSLPNDSNWTEENYSRGLKEIDDIILWNISRCTNNY